MRKILLLGFVVLLGGNCDAMDNSVSNKARMLAAKVSGLANEVTALANEVTSLADIADTLESQLQAANATVGAHKAELAEWGQKWARQEKDAQSKGAAYERRLKEREDELASYQKQLGERDAKLADYQRQIDDQKAAIGDYAQREQWLRSEVDRSAKASRAKDYALAAAKEAHHEKTDALISSPLAKSGKISARNVGKKVPARQKAR